MDDDSNDPPPRAEFSRDAPSRLLGVGRTGSRAASSQSFTDCRRIVGDRRGHVLDVDENDEVPTEARRAVLRRMSSTIKLSRSAVELAAMLRRREHRDIEQKLKHVPLTYDAVFARLQREKALQSLQADPYVLRRDKRLVQQKIRRANMFLLRPDGTFMSWFDVAQLSALFYTVVVTPYEIAFASVSSSQLLLASNYIVLLVFVAQILVNFVLPYQEEIWKGGRLVRGHRKIARRYLRSWFLFDLISCIPIDQLVAAIVVVNETDSLKSNGAGNTGRGSDTLELLRMVRLFRLIKLGRLLAASRVFERISIRFENTIIVSFTVRTTLKWMMVLVVTVHWCCCTWGVLALLQSSQRTQEALTAIGTHCIDAPRVIDIQPNRPPGSCLSECEIEALASAQKVLATYIRQQEIWTCRAIMSGMIPRDLIQNGASPYMFLLHTHGLLYLPKRNDEFVVLFFQAFILIIVDSLFVAAVCGTFANADPLKNEYQARMDRLNVFLRVVNAPTELRRRTRAFMRATREVQLKRSFKELYTHFSDRLASDMKSHMSISTMNRCYIFRECERSFVRDLASRFKYQAYEAGEAIRHPNPTMSIVIKGTAVRGGKPYALGQLWGEDCIVTSAALRDQRPAVALTYCEICYLHREDIQTVSKDWPASARVLRLEALKIAMFRAPQLIASYIKHYELQESRKRVMRKNNVARRRRNSGDGGSEDGHSCGGSTTTYDSVTSEAPRDYTTMQEALLNLGADASAEHKEIHRFFHAINGGRSLQGLASELQDSEDPTVAFKARQAHEFIEIAHPGGQGDLFNPAAEVLMDDSGQEVHDTEQPREAVYGADEHLPQHEELVMAIDNLRLGQERLKEDIMKVQTATAHELHTVQQQNAAVLAAVKQLLERKNRAESRAARPPPPPPPQAQAPSQDSGEMVRC